MDHSLKSAALVNSAKTCQWLYTQWEGQVARERIYRPQTTGSTQFTPHFFLEMTKHLRLFKCARTHTYTQSIVHYKPNRLLRTKPFIKNQARKEKMKTEAAC